jgi:hypothetical protein
MARTWGYAAMPCYLPHFQTQVAFGGMFGAAQPLLLKFPLDRGIFLREYATQTYGAAPYFIAKSMVELWRQGDFVS